MYATVITIVMIGPMKEIVRDDVPPLLHQSLERLVVSVGDSYAQPGDVFLEIIYATVITIVMIGPMKEIVRYHVLPLLQQEAQGERHAMDVRHSCAHLGIVFPDFMYAMAIMIVVIIPMKEIVRDGILPLHQYLVALGFQIKLVDTRMVAGMCKGMSRYFITAYGERSVMITLTIKMPMCSAG